MLIPFIVISRPIVISTVIVARFTVTVHFRTIITSTELLLLLRTELLLVLRVPTWRPLSLLLLSRVPTWGPLSLLRVVRGGLRVSITEDRVCMMLVTP